MNSDCIASVRPSVQPAADKPNAVCKVKSYGPIKNATFGS